MRNSNSAWLPALNSLELPKYRVETPTDERGLVDIPRTLEIVQSMIKPGYILSNEDSTHHFYWWANLYQQSRDERRVNPSFFRELPIHKGELPREFENLLHQVTMPVAPPKAEVMQYRVESWLVARSLFDSATKIIEWRRRAEDRINSGEDPNIVRPEGDIYAKEWMAETIDRHFDGVEQHMKDMARVPPEFRLIEPCNNPTELAQALGTLVIPRSLRIAQAWRNQRPLPMTG